MIDVGSRYGPLRSLVFQIEFQNVVVESCSQPFEEVKMNRVYIRMALLYSTFQPASTTLPNIISSSTCKE